MLIFLFKYTILNISFYVGSRNYWRDGSVHKTLATQAWGWVQIPRTHIKAKQAWWPPVIPALCSQRQGMPRTSCAGRIASQGAPSSARDLPQKMKWRALKEDIQHQLWVLTCMCTYMLSHTCKHVCSYIYMKKYLKFLYTLFYFIIIYSMLLAILDFRITYFWWHCHHKVIVYFW